MDSFSNHTGLVAPLDRANVDTDQIIPAQFLKRIERTGFGPFLFFDWRKLPDGTPDPEFVLNQPAYQEGTILVAGRNFGGGSSREHAVWALMNYGFKVVISSGFADIFHKNCFESGLIPVILPEDQVRAIMEKAKTSPGYRLTVDLERSEISDDHGLHAPFVVHEDPGTHAYRRNTLLNGLDSINLTLRHEDKIRAYEERTARAEN